MTSWLNAFDSDPSDRFYIGASSIPMSRKSRKRSSAVAELGLLDDNFEEDFERRLKLTPSARERLKVADGFLKDSRFVLILMKSLPETCLRKLAVTCTEWRKLAYRTLRERNGNKAFSLLWIDEGTDSFGQANKEFDLNMFFHDAYLGGLLYSLSIFPIHGRGGMPLLETAKDNCMTMSVDDDGKSENHGHDFTERIQIRSTNYNNNERVQFILTYGSSNMEGDFMSNEQDENKSMKIATIDCSSFLILSSSLLVTTPDCKQTVDAVRSAEPDKKLLASIMFPPCTHIAFECFVVPSTSSEELPVCVSSVIGTFDPTKRPKALILYQYLNLFESEPGIVERALQCLKTTQGSAGFPMVTGIYNYLDANLMNDLNYDGPISHGDPVANGLLICGDNFSNASVISLNLLGSDEVVENNFKEIERFYLDAFTTKYALLFYHNEVTNVDSPGALNFKQFIDDFRGRLPNVMLHGIGSFSGAHAVFINPHSNGSFNQLNARMKGLTETVESKTAAASMELILVLLSYQAD